LRSTLISKFKGCTHDALERSHCGVSWVVGLIDILSWTVV
jgi:hypothetical protein